MATKKDIKAFLKEANLTEANMDDFWSELILFNLTCRSLYNAGKGWRDLGIHMIKNIPTQKQRDIESEERQAAEAKATAEAELKAKQDKEYYTKHFDEVMLQKIDQGKDLSEYELRELVWGYECHKYREIGDDRRWSRTITSYIQLGERWFEIQWEEGLTEVQENSYYDQPVEVALETWEEIIPEHKITLNKWIKVQK